MKGGILCRLYGGGGKRSAAVICGWRRKPACRQQRRRRQQQVDCGQEGGEWEYCLTACLPPAAAMGFAIEGGGRRRSLPAASSGGVMRVTDEGGKSAKCAAACLAL